MKPRIMYIENKHDDTELFGTARIGLVKFSKTGKTLYYRNAELQSLKGYGFKANYYDVNTGEYYWVSGPKKKGQDTLYTDKIFIDGDVLEEYWRDIRGIECDDKIMHSQGKHTGWRALEYRRKYA